MEVNLSSLLEGTMLYLLIFIILLLILVIILIFIYKNVKRSVKIKEDIQESENILQVQIDNLRNSNKEPEQIIEEVSRFAGNILVQTYGLNQDIDYSEMSRILEEKDKKKAVFLCQQMLFSLYSGEKVTKEKIDSILNSLDAILREEKPKVKVQEEIIEQAKSAPPISLRPLQELEKKGERPRIEIKLTSKPEIGQSQKPESALASKAEAIQEIKPVSPLEIIKERPSIEVIFPPELKGKHFEMPSMKLIEKKEEKPLVKQTEIPISPQKPLPPSLKTSPLITMPQREQVHKDMIRKLNSLDMEQINDAYSLLQKRFQLAYMLCQQKKDREFLSRLDSFREDMIRIVKEYAIKKDIVKLAQEISKGVKLIMMVLSY